MTETPRSTRCTATVGDDPVEEPRDWGDGHSVSTAVVGAVAAAEGVPASDLDARLSDAINTDALNSLFEPTGGGSPACGAVWFEFAGHRVVVDSRGEIRVGPPSIDGTESSGP